MDKPTLNDTLKQLHTQLGQAEAIDDDTRASLRTLARDIQRLLDDNAGEAADYQPLLKQLNDAIVRFEGSHPTLALAITQAINALVDIGV